MKNVWRWSQKTFDAVAEVTDIVLCLTLQGKKNNLCVEDNDDAYLFV